VSVCDGDVLVCDGDVSVCDCDVSVCDEDVLVCDGDVSVCDCDVSVCDEDVFCCVFAGHFEALCPGGYGYVRETRGDKIEGSSFSCCGRVECCSRL